MVSGESRVAWPDPEAQRYLSDWTYWLARGGGTCIWFHMYTSFLGKNIEYELRLALLSASFQDSFRTYDVLQSSYHKDTAAFFVSLEISVESSPKWDRSGREGHREA